MRSAGRGKLKALDDAIDAAAKPARAPRALRWADPGTARAASHVLGRAPTVAGWEAPLREISLYSGRSQRA